MSDQEEIVVNGQKDKGPSVGDVIRVGGATLLNPAMVAGQVIRNKRLEDAGDDLGANPTIGGFVRSAEAIGDGLNDRSKNSESQLVAKFNKVAGFNVAGVPVVKFTPSGGVVRTISDVVRTISDVAGGEETFRNRAGDFALGVAENVPVLGSVVSPVAGLLRGNTDVREVRRGIEFLSDNNVPGFKYDETKIDGHTVKIYVSAADTIANGSAEPWVNIDTKGINRSDPRVQARAQAVLGQAQEDIYEFTTDQNDKAIANGTESNPASTQAALHERIRDVVSEKAVASALGESGRIESNNRLVNSASVLADMTLHR